MKTRPGPVKRLLNSKILLAFFIGFLTFILYVPALQNGFVGWDDTTYVSQNPYIKSLNADFFRFAFLRFYLYNWHPLTFISYALDYSIWGPNPFGYHLTNIVLHAVNTLVVVLLVSRLLEAHNRVTVSSGDSPRESFLKKDSGQAGMTNRSGLSPKTKANLIAAGVTGLLFGIHPLHVESVAWIAERKDLLCAFFFLLSIMAYVKYAGSITPPSPSYFKRGWRPACRQAGSGGRYFLSLFFFVLALMSKPMAVSLPVVLLILDWYPLGMISSVRSALKAFVEKVPFFAFSLASAVVTVMAQKSGGNIWEALPLSTRLPVAAQSLCVYLWKMIAPLDLLPFYPYPRHASLSSPEYIAYVAIIAGITAAGLMLAKRWRILPAVWAYYVITLLPVLGILQAGGQSMADRYTYLPSLGPFLLAGLGAAWVFSKVSLLKRAAAGRLAAGAAGVFLAIALSFLTVNQTGIWKDGITLWSYVISKEPTKVLIAYYNRGLALTKQGRYYEAIQDFSKVIAWNYEEYSPVYVERGLAYLAVGQTGPAATDLKKACDLGNTFGCNALRYDIKTSR